MRIEQRHELTGAEIKKRADALADNLVTMPIPGGVSVGNLSREWHDDAMDFSFRVSKGFFGADIKGQILVSDSNVVLEIKMPPIVSSFVSEEKIQEIVQAKMAEAVK